MSVLSPIAPSRTAGAPPKRGRLLRWAVRIGSLAAAVLAWQLLTANDARVWVRFDQLPTVGEILDNVASNSEGRSTTRISPTASAGS